MGLFLELGRKGGGVGVIFFFWLTEEMWEFGSLGVEEKQNSVEETRDFKSKCVRLLVFFALAASSLPSVRSPDISVPTCACFHSLLTL